MRLFDVSTQGYVRSPGTPRLCLPAPATAQSLSSLHTGWSHSAGSM